MRERRYWSVLVAGMLLLSLLACSLPCPLTGGGGEVEEAVSEVREDEPEEAPEVSDVQEEEPELEPEPELKLGDTVQAEGVEIYIPPDTQDEQPPISVQLATEEPPPPPEGSNAVGEAYEVTSEGELAGPVLITLSYDPEELTPGVSEENLYIATRVGDGWEAVPDGFVDPTNHTVSAPVEHFSLFGVMESVAEAVYEATIETNFVDEMNTGIYFADLPQSIKQDIYDEMIPTHDVTGIVHMRLSRTTIKASAWLAAANLLSRGATMAIGVVEDTQEALLKAVALTAVGEGLRDSEVGTFVFTMYDSASLGWDIGTYIADPSMGSPHVLIAKGAAWLLAREMDYINRHVDQAFTPLYQFNPHSQKRLQVYALFVDAEPWIESTGAKGYRFYYYDELQDTWINYYNDMVYWKVEFQPQEGGEVEQAAEVREGTPTRKPASTPTRRRTATPKPASTATTKPKPVTPIPTSTPQRPTSGTIYLTADGSGDYPTIQEAIDAVEPGTTIFLDEGTYEEWEIEIDKPLSLLGARKDLVRIVSDIGYSINLGGGDSVTLEDITFLPEGDSEVLVVKGGEVKIANCAFVGIELLFKGNTRGYVRDCEIADTGDGIYLTDQAQITIERNLIAGCSNGISYRDNAGGVARNNEIRNNVDGIDIEDNANPTIEGNTIIENGAPGTYVGNGIRCAGNSNTIIRGNECSWNLWHGIVIWYDEAHAVVEDNICNNNGDSGILFSDSNGSCSGNECSGNGTFGIEIGSGSNVNLGSNYCHGNADRDIADFRD